MDPAYLQQIQIGQLRWLINWTTLLKLLLLHAVTSFQQQIQDIVQPVNSNPM